MSRYFTDAGKPRLIPTSPRNWWDYRDTLLAVADFGVETGELDSARNVVYFFEKPWKFEEIHEAWQDEQANQAEQQWLDRYADV